MKKWWITPAGDSCKVENHWTFALDRPGVFGLDADDAAFVRSRMYETDALEAMLDKVLLCGIVDKEEQERAGDHDTPAVMIEFSRGKLYVIFHRESYPLYERLMRWLGENSSEFLKDTPVILKEWGTQRAWDQTVETLAKKGYQFAKNPSRGVRCNKCGATISIDELIARGKCGKCGAMLA